MLKRVLHKEYPTNVVSRIVEKQFRLTLADGELYDNANVVVRNAFDIAEDWTNRNIVQSTITVSIDAFRSALSLNVMPVKTIVSIQFYNADDVLTTLENAKYNLVATNDVTTIEFFDIPILSKSQRIEKIIITLECGYDDYLIGDSASIPPNRLPGAIESAVQMLAGNMLEADGDVVIGRSISAMPTSAKNLLQPYRVHPYGR